MAQPPTSLFFEPPSPKSLSLLRQPRALPDSYRRSGLRLLWLSVLLPKQLEIWRPMRLLAGDIGAPGLGGRQEMRRSGLLAVIG